MALLFEKAAREIDVACALKHILARRHGLTTAIIQQDHPHPRLFADTNPALVVLSSCYTERNNSAFLMQWHRKPFFNLAWEQFFYPGNAKAKTTRGEFAVRHVMHNAWSDSYADFLRSQGVPEAHIFVGGHPAYTLYDAPYRRYFKPRQALASEYGLDPGRRWVFFPENYNWAFYEPVMFEQMIRDGHEASDVYALRDIVGRSFDVAMRWCAALARSANVEVIIRPRPTTPVEVFRERVAGVMSDIPPTLSIIQDETVRDWIIASDVVVSSYSTSLIEASIAGKPIFMIEPEPWPVALDVSWHRLVPRVTSEEEFLAAAMGDRGDDAGAALGSWARGALMNHGDSIVRIADRIAQIRAGAVEIPKPAPWSSVTLPNRYHLPNVAAYAYRRYLHSRSVPREDGVVRPELREDIRAWREVPERVARWQHILDAYLVSFEA